MDYLCVAVFILIWQFSVVKLCLLQVKLENDDTSSTCSYYYYYYYVIKLVLSAKPK